jgi:hypothetical protein
MIDMARANVEAVLDLSQQIATAKAPSDVVELWTAHAHKQFEMLSEQSKEPAALAQKMAGRNDNAQLQPDLPESLLKEPKELREWPGHIKSSSAW